MKKHTPKQPDANQTAFAGLQELLRRDKERDKTKEKDAKKTDIQPRQPKSAQAV